MAFYLPSLKKLEAMFDLYVRKDNWKLDAGEVDAMAAFYGGLKPASQEKIRPRLVQIYREASYSSGQQARFLEKLTGAGIPLTELEGVSGDTAAEFLRMTKPAQRNRLLELEYDVDTARDIDPSAVPAQVRAKITRTMDKVIADLPSNHEAGDQFFREIYLRGDGAGSFEELVGYGVLLGIFESSGPDISQMYFFNAEGVLVGEDYRGE